MCFESCYSCFWRWRKSSSQNQTGTSRYVKVKVLEDNLTIAVAKSGNKAVKESNKKSKKSLKKENEIIIKEIKVKNDNLEKVENKIEYI